MPHYLHQIAYTAGGWEGLVKNPQNRFDAVRPAIEGLGGKLVTGYLCFGEYDIIAITEMPGNVDAAAFAIAVAAGGTVKSVHTTPLITPEEGMQAMQKASGSSYRPASS
jgi:uncharacterized protein with GYD domain